MVGAGLPAFDIKKGCLQPFFIRKEISLGNEISFHIIKCFAVNMCSESPVTELSIRKGEEDGAGADLEICG